MQFNTIGLHLATNGHGEKSYQRNELGEFVCYAAQGPTTYTARDMTFCKKESLTQLQKVVWPLYDGTGTDELLGEIRQSSTAIAIPNKSYNFS